MPHSVIRIIVAATLLAAAACASGDDADVIAEAQRAMDTGRFTEAENLLRERIADPAAPIVDGPAVALEIARRVRLDYALTAERLLAKLRADIPDATAEDVQRWTESGDLQHRVIDGEVRYFNRAAGTLLRFSQEAKSRRVFQPRPAGDDFDVPAHVARLVRLADESDSPMVYPVKHHIRYELRVKENNPRLRAGAKVRCWLPFPQEYRQQRDVRLIKTEPAGGVVAPGDQAQRTVYFEMVIDDPTVAPVFAAEFEFVTFAYCPKLSAADVAPYDKESPLYREYTAERLPHIAFAPGVRALAAKIVGDEPNPLERARRIFRWVSRNIPWCAEMEYSTIPSLSGKGLSARRGDCGVQSMVFITLCRAAGIPARWQSGWQTKPNDWNMHDWSEFYVEPWGWLPADASNGLQEHADPRVREFFCGHMDPYRMIVNVDYARELHPPKTSFRSEPNDFQRGEIEIDGHNLYFDEWRWSLQLRTTPLDGGFAALAEALHAAVPDWLKEGGIPGAVIAVGRKTATGYETLERAYGFLRSQPRPRPMRAAAIFDLASMTKPIATGTSLMILAQRGELGLDDPVGKYLPEFGAGDKKDVTIRHLMTHMSGLPPYVGARQQKVIKDKAGFPCPSETRAYIRNLDLAHKPGEVMVYSCLNAILGAEIVEAVSGQPLDKFASQNIYGPLKMLDTGFNPSIDDAQSQQKPIVPTTRAARARASDGLLTGDVHDPLAAMQAGVSGNAGLFGSAADLSRFAQMMLNGGELDGARVLTPETIRDMTRVQNPGAKNKAGQPDRRGLLWDLYPPDAGDTGVDTLFAYGHTGYTGTAIRIYPEQGVYIIALTNRVHPDDKGKVTEFRRHVWHTVGQMLMNTEE